LLKDYRDWLDAELKLLGNASHHAYAFGQANIARTLYVPIDRAAARRILTAIEMQAEATTSAQPELVALRDAITAALQEVNENPAL